MIQSKLLFLLLFLFSFLHAEACFVVRHDMKEVA